ncbi:MAG TPA: hypothetical protein VN754_04590, partial [Candidatus Binataceae bacterium]|nr:hypothetical protein [Candidatus Binataceae bacterium]
MAARRNAISGSINSGAGGARRGGGVVRYLTAGGICRAGFLAARCATAGLVSTGFAALYRVGAGGGQDLAVMGGAG